MPPQPLVFPSGHFHPRTGAAIPSVVRSDPEILSSTPGFAGTRVPFRALLDYPEGGQTLSEFLDDFPTVTREQAVTALEEAGEAVLAMRVLLDESLTR